MITIREAVTSLKEEYPDMCEHGLADTFQGARPVHLDELITEAERWPQLIELCRTWLSQCPQVKTMRWQEDTYSYKNEVEAWSGVTWIPHIAVLVAARQLGLPMEQNKARPYAGRLPLGAKRP